MMGLLRQAVGAAAPRAGHDVVPPWQSLPDGALENQGRASAMTGRAIATRLVPALPDLAARLAAGGARILDVGTGVGELAIALAAALPGTQVVGIDVFDRALALARRRREMLPDPLRARLSLVRLDVTALSPDDRFDLVWLPAPFIDEEVLTTAVTAIRAALTEPGWVVVGTNPDVGDERARAVRRWAAERTGGSAALESDVEALLRAAGFRGVVRHPTVPGGPILLSASTG